MNPESIIAIVFTAHMQNHKSNESLIEMLRGIYLGCDISKLCLFLPDDMRARGKANVLTPKDQGEKENV